MLALIASCESLVRAENSLKLILIGIMFYAGSSCITGRIWLTPLASKDLIILFSWAETKVGLKLTPGQGFIFDCSPLATFITRKIESVITA